MTDFLAVRYNEGDVGIVPDGEPMTTVDEPSAEMDEPENAPVSRMPLLPLPNYTLSDVCPRCNTPVTRRACKVLCPACGFMWDCSEL